MRGELNALGGKIGAPFSPLLIFIHGEAGSKICYFLLENHLLPPPVSFSAFYVLSLIENERMFF